MLVGEGSSLRCVKARWAGKTESLSIGELSDGPVFRIRCAGRAQSEQRAFLEVQLVCRAGTRCEKRRTEAVGVVDS